MKIFNIALFLLIINICYSQKKLPDFSECNTLSEKELIDSDYTLIIVSGAGCGYCELALQQLKTYKNKDKINIIIYEYGSIDKITNMHSDYFNDFIFIEGNGCSYFSDKLFPVYYLYNKDKLIWKEKSFKKDKLERLDKKII